MDITPEQAINFLDPVTKAHDADKELMTTACYMGAAAILHRIPKSPYPDDDKSILACPVCGSGEFLHNPDGAENAFCGQCGQAIKWED